MTSKRNDLGMTQVWERERHWPQVCAVAVACIASISDGLLQAWSSPFMVVVLKDEETYHITEDQASYFAILPSVSMMLSCFFFATLCDKIGRRRTLMLSAIPHISAWILTIFARDVYLFYLSRILAGCGTGCLFVVMPAYVGEIASPKVRGMTASFLATFNFFGQFLINVIGNYFSIQISALVCLPVPILFLAWFHFMPESPYFLIMQKRYEEAADALKILTRKRNVRADFEKIKSVVERQMSEAGTWKDLVTVPCNRRAIGLGTVLRLTQLIGGMGIYTTSSQFIFEKSNGFLPSDVASMTFMSSTFIFYFLGGMIIDKYGRRSGYMVSQFLCGIFLLLEASYFYLDQHTEADLSNLSWFPLVGLILCIVSGSIGQAPIPTIMVSELFSASVKAKATTLMACVFGIGMTVSNTLFYQVNNFTGLYGPFIIFGLTNILAIVWTYFYLPETRGRTLDEVQQILQSGKLKLEKKLFIPQTVYSVSS